MQAPLWDLKNALSEERFAEYSATAASDAEAVGRYVWNARLCEALYQPLCHLEIALRNNLHHAITRRYPTGPWADLECWFDLITPILRPDETKAVAKAKTRLVEQGKPLAIGRVVAELNFGFWNSLLDLHYERANILWPHLLKDVFPHMPKSQRKRKVVSARINAIRLLRNRVFHHEPIWHWKDLKTKHIELFEAIGWLSNDLLILSTRSDRFADVFHEGWNRHSTGVLG